MMVYIKHLLGTFFLFFLLLAIIPSPNTEAQVTFQNDNTTTAVCSEQLQICVDEFNSLLADFRNGTNCNSETFNQLKRMNNDVSADREKLRKEVENLRTYKTSFYIVSILLVVWIIFVLVTKYSSSKNKSRRLKNGRETGKERKETHR